MANKGSILVSSGNDPGPVGGSRRGGSGTSGGGGRAAPRAPRFPRAPRLPAPPAAASPAPSPGARGLRGSGNAGGGGCEVSRLFTGDSRSSPGGRARGSMSAFLSPPAEGPRPGWAAGGARVGPARICLCEAGAGEGRGSAGAQEGAAGRGCRSLAPRSGRSRRVTKSAEWCGEGSDSKSRGMKGIGCTDTVQLHLRPPPFAHALEEK